MEISNLPNDLVEEVLSKLPITSVRTIRLTCKSWNTLSKTQSFAEKHTSHLAKSKSGLFFTLFSEMSLMSLDLHNIDSSIKLQCNFRRCDIFQIVHCDGLLLEIKRNNAGLIVWNPYLGEKRLVRARTSYGGSDIYAIGYKEMKNNKSRSHKILRLMHSYGYEPDIYEVTSKYEVYDLETSSWRCFDMTLPDWMIKTFFQFGISYHMGTSVKGNTYWVTQTRKIGDKKERFLICFDFTRERFGPCLRFPFQSYVDVEDGWVCITLSSVREEQLVVLVQRRDGQKRDMLRMEIWITSKITPQKVFWNKLWLGVDMPSPFNNRRFIFPTTGESFFVDEEKKVFVFIGESECGTRIEACVIGENGCLERVDLGRDSWSKYKSRPLMRSYVPSCVHVMKQAVEVVGKRKHMQYGFSERGKLLTSSSDQPLEIMRRIRTCH